MGWNQIEIFIGITNLDEDNQHAVRFKLESIGKVWDSSYDNYELTELWDIAYYPPLSNDAIIENSNWTTLPNNGWLGFEFANTANVSPPMDSYGYGLYRFSGKIDYIDSNGYPHSRVTYFYIDYRDDFYSYFNSDLFPNLEGHHADTWFMFDAYFDDPKFYYSTYSPISSGSFTNEIEEGQLLKIWEIKNTILDGAPSTSKFEDFWQNCLVSINTGTHPHLVWGAHPSGATSYKIYKKKDSPNYELLATTTELDYHDTSEYIYDGGGNKTYAHYYVKANLTAGGTSSASNTVSSAVDGVGQVEKPSVRNKNDFELSLSNYPNPFNPTTTIEYSVNVETFISLEVFNLLGEQVSTLVNKKQQPGTYEVKFDGSTLPSGLYFYTLRTNNSVKTKRMLLLK